MNIIEKIKSLWIVKKFIDTEIKGAKQMNEQKPGYKTSEFYLTLLTNVVALIGALKGIIPDSTATIIIAAANAIYGLIRAITKTGTSTGTSDASANVTVKAS